MGISDAAQDGRWVMVVLRLAGAACGDVAVIAARVAAESDALTEVRTIRSLCKGPGDSFWAASG